MTTYSYRDSDVSPLLDISENLKKLSRTLSVSRINLLVPSLPLDLKNGKFTTIRNTTMSTVYNPRPRNSPIVEKSNSAYLPPLQSKGEKQTTVLQSEIGIQAIRH